MKILIHLFFPVLVFSLRHSVYQENLKYRVICEYEFHRGISAVFGSNVFVLEQPVSTDNGIKSDVCSQAHSVNTTDCNFIQTRSFKKVNCQLSLSIILSNFSTFSSCLNFG